MDQYRFCRLGIDDLDEILAIEEAVYTHPWTRGNFLDSFYDRHEAWGIRDQQENLVAYFFLMPVVDELHLLTFAVDAQKQQLGYAHIMLKKMLQIAQEQNFLSIMLEVRVSNVRAITIYQRFGFLEIGRRKSYYPAHEGLREDAIVMRIEAVPT
ncbi:ribosomal protein S18-alanine N-acetyltransferase [Undibacterium sp. LX15W]|uniref:[Ribosomal protein bS18]-alanine N-acetyltransferase n=2 Tax=Undibacterium flavidum TaxID=2762297 RepID=A0ABR6YEI8_9BURK|nr:ribosomal protein S18-alanine N-acetyltransferase [Undibacterium flavidum]